MPTETPKKIVLVEQVPGSGHDEVVAGAAVTPGMLVEQQTDGKYDVHSGAGTPSELIFAKENTLEGKTIDDAYADEDWMPIHRAKEGDIIYAFIAAGVDITAKGIPLQSAGDGTLLAATTADNVVAYSHEAVDNDPGSGGANARIRVRVGRGYVAA